MKNSQLSAIILLFGLLLINPYFTSPRNTSQLANQSVDLTPPLPDAPFDNVILMIGDGMGWGQINATKKWLGTSANLTMAELSYLGDIETYSLDASVTDSAAAATALATGNRTNNNMVSMLPDGQVLTTILEAAEALGKATGLVTTTPLYHGTPGPFSAHVSHRNQYATIAQQQLTKGIEVLLGGGLEDYSARLGTAIAKGYHIVENRTDMLASVTEDYLLGLFADFSMNYEYDRNPLNEPHITEMTNVSLQILDRDTDGFFLMVEGGRIDHACHDWHINHTIGETIAFDEAVQVAYQYARQTPRTLLIVTADHECGGLWVNMSNPDLQYQFTDTYHTAAPVPVFVYHNTSEILPSFTHLTDIGEYLFEAFGLVPRHLPFEWLDSPTDQQIEFGDPCYYQLNIFSTNPIDTWWINDTTHFTIDGTGLIRNATPLIVGDYGLEVRVNDTSALTLTTTFTFSIRDTTVPTWVNSPQNLILNFGNALHIQLNATDRSGIAQWYINDTTNFLLSSSGLLQSVSGVSPGTYGLNVTVSDPYGNALSTTFKVTFLESTIPTSFPEIPGYPIVSIFIGLILGCFVVILIHRKRRQSL
ncbi:MAG: alkaline phosphatase [Promethearchaeota archaeon]